MEHRAQVECIKKQGNEIGHKMELCTLLWLEFEPLFIIACIVIINYVLEDPLTKK